MLAVSAAVLWIANTAMFYPGFMSSDSLKQLSQALGVQPYHDWHPPIMAFLWSIGIGLTGTIGSMLAFQLLLLWGSLFLLALYIYRVSGSWWLSLLPIVLGLSPVIINISGVIWKDVHMAFALLWATVCILWLRLAINKKVRIALFIGIISCLMYALLLRYNALFAVLPISYLAVAQITRNWKIHVASMIGILLLSVAVNTVLNSSLNVIKSNPTSTVMLDDVIHSVPRSRILASNASKDLKQELITIQSICNSENVLMHSYLFCSTKEQQVKIQYTYYDELKSLWFSMLKHNALSYLKYRVETFAVFLVTPRQYQYIEHSDIDQNVLGQHTRHPVIARILGFAINEGVAKDFGFLYRPYFWLLVSVLALLYGLRSSKKYRLEITLITVSTISYTIGYFPLVIAGDYRYIYWPVLGGCVALLLIILEKYNYLHKAKLPKSRAG